MDLSGDPYYGGAAGQGRFVPNVFPERPADFEPAIRAYYAALERLYRTIMRMFAVALDLAEDHFEPMLTHIENTLRLTHYPALERAPEPGELRAGEHTDGGICTILHIDDTPDSLAVKTRSGKWIFVNRTPGTFVVNIGDLMMRWTNDKWVSTVHRVVNPPFVNGRAERRLSIVTFCQVNHDTVIDCLPNCSGPGNPPRYEPVRSDEFKKKSYAQVYGLPQPAAAE
jgi:isopenicillin N synthase-like dioxygenase